MVRINNGLEGHNEPYVDAYLRNIHEFRVSCELALLPVLNFFIAQSESEDTFLLPGPLFEQEREYLYFLAERYKKRPFVFNTQETEDPIYFSLARLIHKTRKYVAYCVNDLLDVLHEQPELINGVQLHQNIVRVADNLKELYHKQLPEQYAHLFGIEEPRNKHYPDSESSIEQKYTDVFQLYMACLSALKRDAIDFELLKLHDFLLEIDIEAIHSDALLEIIDDVGRIATTEYAKHAVDIAIKPTKYSQGSQQRFDLFMEEWASNIRRALEMRMLLAKDFLMYMNKHATPQQREYLAAGCYPEVSMLIADIQDQLGLQRVAE